MDKVSYSVPGDNTREHIISSALPFVLSAAATWGGGINSTASARAGIRR